MKATTFRISDRQVVHHILSGTVAADHTGNTFSESQWGASLGGYGPGRGSNIQPVDTGVFDPDPSGRALFESKELAANRTAQNFAVTIEPRGGLPQPSGPIVLAGTPSG